MTTLDSLARSWPPAGLEFPATGYRRPRPEDLTPVDAFGVQDAGCLGVFSDDKHELWSLPLSDSGGSWHIASETDHVASALVELAEAGPTRHGRFSLHAAPGSLHEWHHSGHERYLTTDQTHISAVVDDAVIVKWFSRPASPDVAGLRLRHLQDVGFFEVPRHLADLTWEGVASPQIVATITQFLPDTEDGWTWCCEALAAHLAHGGAACGDGCPGWFAADLGALLARFHAATATPSSFVEHPLTLASEVTVQSWKHRCTQRVQEAQAAFVTELPIETILQWSEAVAALPTAKATPLIVVHGDLHVGQILKARSRAEYALIDLEGDPLEVRPSALDSPMRDVAHLLTSIALVGQVVLKQVGGPTEPVGDWAATSADLFLTAYLAELRESEVESLADLELLVPFLAAQLASELVYANRALPRWAYAPLGLARTSWLERLRTQVGTLAA